MLAMYPGGRRTHLTHLAALPADRFTFTAVPPKIEGAGTFTVRAFAAT